MRTPKGEWELEQSGGVWEELVEEYSRVNPGGMQEPCTFLSSPFPVLIEWGPYLYETATFRRVQNTPIPI